MLLAMAAEHHHGLPEGGPLVNFEVTRRVVVALFVRDLLEEKVLPSLALCLLK